ncbi:SGNH/GDSL hydrolase family protein [Flavobacterium algicola]|uniref:SGNH/GDSL hydrolase family protein n=1 Tax=Flavobacterium algicola TaxID=556529 RepID=UPI001EFE165D|nr:SGNH/GDSL hydrolase family protein [Flavobacterium algicola]MCG9792338.1 SGNH/GDSL hydrolase family protein [Flavobacterium algicola]
MEHSNRRKFIKTISILGLVPFIPIDLLGATNLGSCNVCKEAWNGLSKMNETRYQFRYIEPSSLPNVFLYGDSISIGYTEYVRASLKGKANVMRLHVNGGSSHDLFLKMEAFRKAMFQPDLKGGWNFEWDVIHFNVGLHDLKYVANKVDLDKVNGKLVSTLAVYENKLRENIKYLKTTYPNAKLIFATTTVVPDGEPGRFKDGELKYNEVALKVLKEYPEIRVNNLHDLSIPIIKKYQDKLGSVHYLPEGYRLLGIEVAKQIAKVLDVPTVECPSAAVIEKEFKEYEK